MPHALPRRTRRPALAGAVLAVAAVPVAVIGPLLAGPVKTNTLWKGFGGPCETHNDGDPVVLYGHLANRWVQSQFALPGSPPFYQCVAVSTSGDPTGTWYRYAFATSRTDWNDYA